MKPIFQGLFILFWIFLLSDATQNDVNIAVVEETFISTYVPDFVKGEKSNKTNQVVEAGTGVPDKIDFTVTLVNDQSQNTEPVVLKLRRTNSRNELKDVYVWRQNSKGEDVLVKENIPVDEDVALFEDKERGGVFTVKCKGMANGDCEPELLGSFYHDGSEFDLKPVTENSPKRVKRKVQKKQKNIGKHIKQRQNLRRNFKKSITAAKEAKRKRKQKLYVIKKKNQASVLPTKNDYQPRVYLQRLLDRKINNKNKNRKNKNGTVDVMSSANDIGLTSQTDQHQSQAVLTVARMTDADGSAILQTTREVTQEPAAVQETSTTINTAEFHYGVELLIVVDFSIYDRFYRESEMTDPVERDIDAKKSIRRYFAHIVNGMDIRYRQIVHPKFTIGVSVIGYFVADAPSKSVWTSDGPVQPRQHVNVTIALQSLSTWQRTMKSMPQHDHMMLFTAHDLYFSSSLDQTDFSVAGFANVGAICNLDLENFTSVSLNEDLGDFASVHTATHELAHSLGASHDGADHDETAKNCSADDNFIMSPKSGVTTALTKENPFKFSECTILAIERLVEVLDRNNFNCLTNEVITFMESEFNATISEMPGQILGPNEQCKRKLGPKSFYGWGGALGEFSDVCTNMACRLPSTEKSYNVYSAVRGTSCGDKKWCLNGICTRSDDAPQKNESCVHGDSERIISGKNCTQAITDLPGNCYHDFYRKQCCISCKNAYNASYPKGCEYGDRYTDCALMNKAQCYEYNTECCMTCPKYDTGIPHCKYGDKWLNCQTTYCNNVTYAEHCCQTCNYTPPTTTKAPPTTTTPTPTTTTTKLPPGPLCVQPGALTHGVTCKQLQTLFSSWGSDICQVARFKDDCCGSCCIDTSPLCNNLHMSSCYKSTVLAACPCGCKEFATGIPVCPYGDRLTDCKSYMQLGSWFCVSYAQYCCTSCNATAATFQNTDTSAQAVRNLGAIVEENIVFTPPPSFKEPVQTSTQAPTPTPQHMTSFQDILQQSKQNKNKGPKKFKNKGGSNNKNTINRKKTFQEILEERRQQQRIRDLQRRREWARQFRGRHGF